jgi:hypothetical protein
MKWSTTNSLSREVCAEIGFIHNTQFVEVTQNDGLVYVRGTLGKPDEFRALEVACRERGFVYLPKNERTAKAQVQAWAGHVEDEKSRREAKKYGYSIPALDPVVADRIGLLGRQKAVQVAAKAASR